MVREGVTSLVESLHQHARQVERRVQFMEVCGTHTVSVFRHGLRALLPSNLRLVSGPGCPVCVTAQRHIDAAIQLATDPGVIVTTYGDMVRVPGQLGSLESQRAQGADVRIVTSTMGALRVAEQNPDRTVVFVAVGFETTAPATAAAILEAERRGMENFVVLAAHKLVVPAMRALLDAGDAALDGFLCPGHVSVIIGSEAYRPVVQEYGVPCVVVGFEPRDILAALIRLLQQLIAGRPQLENVYATAVRPEGNPVARQLLGKVFVESDTPWRALGVIPESGLELRPRYHGFDALRRFGMSLGEDVDHPACRCGEVICGRAMPDECQLFGTACTPLRPFGPCMVSSEGTCSAWYKYNRRTTIATAEQDPAS